MQSGADTVKIALGAGVTAQATVSGKSLTIFAGTAMDIKLMSGSATIGVFRGVERGVTLDVPQAFDRLEITSPTTQVVALIASFGEVKDRRFALPGSALPVNALGGTLSETADAAAPVSVGAGLSVQVAAANASRQQVLVRNTSVTDSIYIRSDAAASESAIVIPANSTYFAEITSAVFCYNPSGSAINVYVSEVV